MVGAGCSSSQTATPTLSSVPSPSPSPSPNPSPTKAAAGCHIGVLWDNYNYVEFWEAPAINAVFNREGVDWKEVESKDSVDYQESDIDSFVSDGVDVIIVRGIGYGSTSAAVTRATAAGIPVIAEDSLLENPNVLWVSSDSVAVGRMEAQAVLAAKPKGKYVIIKGHQDQVADLERQGIGEVLQPALDSGAIKIVAETYTENWDPFVAYTELLAILRENHNQIDAAIVENDGMAAGVIKALEEQGLKGKVAVSGATADVFGLQSVAAGTQTVDVWQDHRQLGTAAAEAAVELCRIHDMAMVSGAKQITSPAGNKMWQIQFQPQAITRDNLNLALDSGLITKNDLCTDVDPAAAPAEPQGSTLTRSLCPAGSLEASRPRTAELVRRTQ